MTLSFGGGAGALTIPGLTGDGKSPAGIVVQGGGQFGGTLSALLVEGGFAYGSVSQNTGSNFVAGDPFSSFTVDAVYSVSADITASIGDAGLTLSRTGMYLALVDAYLDDAPIATGRIECRAYPTPFPTSIYVIPVPCLSPSLSEDQATEFRIFRVDTAPVTVGFQARQTSADDHLMAGDLLVTRIGTI